MFITNITKGLFIMFDANRCIQFPFVYVNFKDNIV